VVVDVAAAALEFVGLHGVRDLVVDPANDAAVIH
jgi:hypothetical protein